MERMTAEQLRAMREANPFRPFTIHLADGRKMDVPHRDFLSLSPSGRIIIVYQPNDAFNVVDLYLVTDLEIHAPSESDGV
jgi:hypothetical protein